MVSEPGMKFVWANMPNIVQLINQLAWLNHNLPEANQAAKSSFLQLICTQKLSLREVSPRSLVVI